MFFIRWPWPRLLDRVDGTVVDVVVEVDSVVVSSVVVVVVDGVVVLLFRPAPDLSILPRRWRAATAKQVKPTFHQELSFESTYQYRCRWQVRLRFRWWRQLWGRSNWISWKLWLHCGWPVIEEQVERLFRVSINRINVATFDFLDQGRTRVGTSWPLRFCPMTRNRSLLLAAERLLTMLLKWSAQQWSPSSKTRLGRLLRRHSSRNSVDTLRTLAFLALTLWRRIRRNLVRTTAIRKKMKRLIQTNDYKIVMKLTEISSAEIIQNVLVSLHLVASFAGFASWKLK